MTRHVSDKGRDFHVLKSLEVQKLGDNDDVSEWLSQQAWKNSQNGSYEAFGESIHEGGPDYYWKHSRNLGGLGPFFCHLLTAEGRLSASNPPENIRILHDPPRHPIHFLQRDDSIEAQVSKQFRLAFGQSLVVHRNAGNEVPLLVGDHPQPGVGEDRVTVDFLRRLELLPTLHSQGDGMRSFAGVLLHTTVGDRHILMVDEPEAFLHPPHARLLGRMMVTERAKDRQIFVATHSGDVLRGILDADSPRVRILRISREGNVNRVKQLGSAQIKQFWSDPLLRYSNVLDGVFHEKVVVCESDGDCRFYAAVADAIFELRSTSDRRPDIMFTHCGGKARVPLVVKSLRELNVPVASVLDFDVLNDERPLRDIFEASGGEWRQIERDWRIVKSAVDSKKPELNTVEVKNEIEKELSGISDPVFPKLVRDRISKILRRASPWALIKGVGFSGVPSGEPSKALENLVKALANNGIFIVPVGELEGFARTIGGHGPTWVNEALQRDLGVDKELEAARTFVGSFVRY